MADSGSQDPRGPQTPGPSSEGGQSANVEARPVEFAELTPGPVDDRGTLTQLLEVKFDVEAVLGRSVLPVERILELGTDSVVELDRLISEPVDLVIQGVTVARGDVVVVDDRFAIRIKEIMQPNN